MLGDNNIDAHRLFVNYGDDVGPDSVLGHSMIYFSGDDGKLHIASPSMQYRPKKNFGSFDDLHDAVVQYIAALKDSKKLNDKEFVEIYDTTDVPFKDIEKWKDYKKKALKGKLLFRQKAANCTTTKRNLKGLLKIAGPSLKDKAHAGVQGAKEDIARRRAEAAYRHANPSYLGSLAQQKARLQTEGQKALARQSPEVQAKFWDDARKFQANAARLRAAAGAFMPGVGLIGASGIIGAGDTAASRIEGNDWNDSTEAGALAALTTYAGGKIFEAALNPVLRSLPKYIGKGRVLVNRLRGRVGKNPTTDVKNPLAPILFEDAAIRSGDETAISGLKEFWTMLGDRRWETLSRAERLAIKAKTGWDMTPRGVPAYFPKYNVQLNPKPYFEGGGVAFTGPDAKKLFKAYPELVEKVTVGQGKRSFLTGGSYAPHTGIITINRGMSPRTVSAHEVHHAIQDAARISPAGPSERGFTKRWYKSLTNKKYLDSTKEFLGDDYSRFLEQAAHDLDAEKRLELAFGRYSAETQEAGARVVEALADDPRLWNATLLEDLYDMPWSNLINGNQHRIVSKFSPTRFGRAVESSAEHRALEAARALAERASATGSAAGERKIIYEDSK